MGRTITTADNAWFTLLTQKTVPIHFDHHVSTQAELGKPLVNSTFTEALATGQSVTDVSQNVFAALDRDEIRLLVPVFGRDTIYSQSELLEKREAKPQESVGVVTVKTSGPSEAN